MKTMIADLSERISIRHFATERNERGDILKGTEVERCRVWAKVYPLTAKVSEGTPEHSNRISYRVTIRRRADIKPDDEIVWRGRRLKLLSPPYAVDGKREFTAFECEEVIEDGAT